MTYDEELLTVVATIDYPIEMNSEAQMAIELALDLTNGDHRDAAEMIQTSELVSPEAKSIAYETLVPSIQEQYDLAYGDPGSYR